MGPFLHTDTAMREDLAMAAQILEERALKTRQFFNAIAEDWDELNREVLEDFDLPAAVLAAVPEGWLTYDEAYGDSYSEDAE